MRYQRSDGGHERIATIDIETTHYKPTQGETVSVGIGVHDRGEPASEATYIPGHRTGDDEADVIEDALQRVDDLGADLLVSYNGRGFDFGFLHDRLELCGYQPVSPALDTPSSHIDLFEDRKQKAEQRARSGRNSRSVSPHMASANR